MTLDQMNEIAMSSAERNYHTPPAPKPVRRITLNEAWDELAEWKKTNLLKAHAESKSDEFYELMELGKDLDDAAVLRRVRSMQGEFREKQRELVREELANGNL